MAGFFRMRENAKERRIFQSCSKPKYEREAHVRRSVLPVLDITQDNVFLRSRIIGKRAAEAHSNKKRKRISTPNS